MSTDEGIRGVEITGPEVPRAEEVLTPEALNSSLSCTGS